MKGAELLYFGQFSSNPSIHATTQIAEIGVAFENSSKIRINVSLNKSPMRLCLEA
jgi:hypothetical protein